jgi:prepilin-type N-terminal cleavage/methylation domain-containing protein
MKIIVNNKYRKGFTLIELMIALVILTVGMLGLLQVYTNYIRINIDNVMRNEAMRISEARMEELRNTAFSSLPADDTTITTTIQRAIRKMTVDFTTITKVNDLSMRKDGVTPNSKAIQVLVKWGNKGTSHQHSAATVITDEW